MILGRSAEIRVAGRVFSYPDLDADITIEFSGGDEANTAGVSIYNLSERSVDIIRRGENIDILQGYRGDIGETFRGVITQVKTTMDGVVKKTEIKANDNLNKWGDLRINKTWKEGYNAADIISQILEEIDLPTRDFSVGKNKSYTDGKSFSCTAREALVQLALDTESKVHIDKGELVFRPFADYDNNEISVSSKSGLMAPPQKSNLEGLETWILQSMLRYEVSTDSLLNVDSRTIKGLFRVVKGKHSPDWTTEVEVANAAQ